MNMLCQIAAAEPVDTNAPVRVLVVDDSLVARAALSRMIDTAVGFEVAATVSDVRAALRFLAERTVEIVILDIDMPGIDGLTALPDLLRASAGARILVVSAACDEGGATAVQAQALGAADTLVKPGTGNLPDQFALTLNERMRRLISPQPQATLAKPLYGAGPQRDFDIVAIGASTGGIHALSQILRQIPAECDLPIIVTQHLPASFMGYFAAQLALLAGRPCDVAADRTRIVPGRIIVAPGDAHLRCVRLREGAAIRLDRDKTTSGCMPSVDPMFASVAEVFGDRALAVVLSGMGRDGSLGATKLAAAGSTIVVQDRESSVVWGMPGTVAASGVAAAVMKPAAIGTLIARSRKP